jgi:hypothetical protein
LRLWNINIKYIEKCSNQQASNEEWESIVTAIIESAKETVQL